MLKETFLNKLKLKYLDNFSKYDYSSIPNVFDCGSKINITCKEHGSFLQTSARHLSGSGCPICTGNYRRTTEEFVERAKKTHGDKYDYNKVDYINIDTKVKIICPRHGLFEQSPYVHLKGHSCPRCNKVYRPTNEEFVERAKKTHGDKYDYNKVDYINNRINIIITCKEHGDFKQIPNNHLRGAGCPICTGNYRRTTEEFIEQIKKIHDNKYDYNKVDYIKAHDKIKITCSKHGDFKQKAYVHLQGHGCPMCKESNGEKYTATVLDKYKINYAREYRILPHRYRYDFYLPEYDIYIEYHGRQHYHGEDYFGGNKQFQKTVKNDKVKIELIKRSTGLLIILKHTSDSLNKIEDELLHLFSIIHPQFLTNKELAKQTIIDSKIFLFNRGIGYKRK